MSMKDLVLGSNYALNVYKRRDVLFAFEIAFGKNKPAINEDNFMTFKIEQKKIMEEIDRMNEINPKIGSDPK